MTGSLAKTLVPGELVARLEAASVGSRDIDQLIDMAFPTDGAPPGYRWALDLIPRYTTSLDAALALAERVLPGWHWGLSKTGACLLDDKEETEVRVNIAHKAPALALCIAILKARTAAETGAAGEAGE